MPEKTIPGVPAVSVFILNFLFFPVKEINCPAVKQRVSEHRNNDENRNSMAYAADLRRFHPFAAGELISRMLCAGAVYFFFSLYIFNAAAS